MTILRKSTLMLSVGIFVGVVLLLLGLLRFYTTDPLEIRALSPSYQDVDSSITTAGRVVPVTDFQARANFSGMIDEVAVRLGDRVKTGQILIKMKDPFAHERVVAATAALQAAKVSRQNVAQGGSQEDRIGLTGDLARAELEQSSAANGLTAVKELRRTGATSDAEVVAATQRLQAANAALRTITDRNKNRYSKSDVESWSTRVADAEANLQAQKTTFENANITSRVDGTVYIVFAKSFDFVPAGADMLHVADLNKVEVRAYFDEPDIGSLHNGLPVTITWDGRNNRVWHGHIARAPLAAMASGSRSVGDCTIAVDDNNAELLPNTSVNVSVLVQHRTHVLALPRETLHTEGGENYVYRVENGQLIRTRVDTGLVTLKSVEVLKGLNTQDVVALRSLDSTEMRNKEKVRMVP